VNQITLQGWYISGLLPLTAKVNATLLQLSHEIEANTLQLPSPPDSITRLRDLIDTDTALLAGQLHNIGETPLLIRINSMPELKHKPELNQAIIKIVYKRLSAKVGVTILKKWHFPPEISQLPLAEMTVANTDSTTNINLNNLLVTSSQVHQCNFSRPLTSLSESFTNSPAFPLFWQDEYMAINNLNDLAQQIHDIQVLLSSH